MDPKVSRDGVPLCPNHADATTPPLGWAMNDLRSTSQALNLESSNQPISSTPPRVRPDADAGVDPDGADDQGTGIAAESKTRASADENGRRRSGSGRRTSRLQLVADGEDDQTPGNRHMSQRQSIRARAGHASGSETIESRPTRRREADEEPAATQESFPWSFDFDDEDEPEELQASTPLLSRAFRSGSR